MRLFARGSW